jgi:hypothetical protein
MANYILKEISEKGYGVFAAQDIRQREHIFHVDLNGFEKYTLAELERAVEENPELDGDHALLRAQFEADFVTESSLRQDNILQAHLAADVNRQVGL